MKVDESKGAFYYNKGSEIKEHMYNIVILNDGSLHYLYEFLSDELLTIHDNQMVKFEVPIDSMVLTNDTYQIGLTDNYKDKRDILIDISQVITKNLNTNDN